MLQTPKHITAIIESHLDQMTRLEKQIASYFTQLDPSSADLSQENTIQPPHFSICSYPFCQKMWIFRLSRICLCLSE